MNLGFGLFFILLSGENYAMLKVKESFKKKDIAFVENLKKDLQRNNDDYATKLHRDALHQNNYVKQTFVASHINASYSNKAMKSIGTPPKTNNEKHYMEVTASRTNLRRKYDKVDDRNKIIDKIRKRVNDALQSKENNSDDPQRRVAIVTDSHEVNNTGIMSLNNLSIIKEPWKNTNKVKHNFSAKMIRNDIKTLSKNNDVLTATPVSTTLLNTTTNIKSKTMNQLQQVKKKKIDKFKKFIQKNKGLLKDFISSKTAMQTPTMPVLHKVNLRNQKRKDSKKLKKSELQELREALESLKEKSKESLERLPRAELLDMAPARGGRIYKRRLRGLLCDRQVLVPEGPKYDSTGLAYVPPHAAGRAREYNATAAPGLLLPRCCNCCRKSVLGCQ